MSPEKFTIEDYLLIMQLYYSVTESISGIIPADQRMLPCQQLAFKLFFHASSALGLYYGTNIPIPFGRGSLFYDFASSSIIARSSIETYLTFHEVYILPRNDDEFEFSYCVWQLSGFIIREKYRPSNPSVESLYTQNLAYIKEMRDRIQKTQYYQQLKPKEQSSILKGKRRRNWEKIYETTGLNEGFIYYMYKYYSGFVHADSLSGIQMIATAGASAQRDHIKFDLSVIAIMLCKMIISYYNKFAIAKYICESNIELLNLVKFYNGAASLIAI